MLRGHSVLSDLLAELSAGVPAAQAAHDAAAAVLVPLQLATPVGTLSFISTTTVFGTPVEITLAELAIEAFFPADALTARLLAPAPEPPTGIASTDTTR